MLLRNPSHLLRRLPLSTLLVGINTSLILLTVAGLVWAAIVLLGRLAEEQAIERVAQAGISAHSLLDRSADDVAAIAYLLAERPTLHRLLVGHDLAALSVFLEQFRQTSHLDGCFVLNNDRLVVACGTTLSAESMISALPPTPGGFLTSSVNQEGPVLGAWATVPSLAQQRVVVLRRLDARFAHEMSDEVGLPITLLDIQRVHTQGTSEQIAMRQASLAAGRPVARRLDQADLFLAVVPLCNQAGDTVGMIEAALPASNISQSLEQVTFTLLLLALGMTVVAAVLNFTLGYWLVRPLKRLTWSAARIGQGDLTTPILSVAGAEIGTLTETLEDMRLRLLQLTADLRHQQAESQAIITGIVEGVFSVDRDRRIRYMNPQAAALFGITPEAAIGHFCGDVLHPRLNDGHRPCDHQCPIVQARSQQGARAIEHLLPPHTEPRTVVITSSPPTDDIQVQVIRDETALEASHRLRDIILAHISHEFRTPLSAQLASLELLLDQLPDLSVTQVGDLLLALKRGTLRLTHLVDNLLESARIEAGQVRIRHSLLQLDEIVEAALEFTQPLFDQRGQSVLVDLPYPLPPIMGDAPRLTQVLVNLLANANKFAPAGTPIEIGGSLAETSVTLWVADAGPGLPSGHVESLFERFVRARENEPEQGGVGLGLWISASIIDRHHGRLEAHSSSVGTRMCITLPLEKETIYENPGG